MIDETKVSIALAKKIGERAGKNMADEHKYADAYERERLARTDGHADRIRLKRRG